MKILALSDVYFPRINGVSTSILTFAREIRALGHHYRIAVPDYPIAAPPEPDLVRVASCAVPFDPEDRLMSIRGLLRAAREAVADGVDVLHVHTPFIAHDAGVILGRELGVPVVETVHTHFEAYASLYLPFLPGGLLRALTKRMARRQCNAVDAVVVPSLAMRERLLEYGVTTPMRVIPTGVDSPRAQGGNRARFRRRLEVADERPVLLFVGRVAHEKNIGFLLEAMARMAVRRPDILLVIAGEGPAGPALKAQARSLGVADHVRFLGYLTAQSELPDAYAGADLFVFASLTETQGLVLLEAMAAGTPVVAIAEMGTRDILEPGRGARSPPADAGAFADCVLELLDDRPLRQALSAEGRAYAGEWSARALAEKLLGFYGEILSEVAVAA